MADLEPAVPSASAPGALSPAPTPASALPQPKASAPPATSGSPLDKCGFAKLVVDGSDYYIRKYEVILGRAHQSAELDVPLGNGMNISRQHAKIVYNFGTQRFELVILGKNGVHIGETHLVPQSPPYPLQSQELLLIGDRLVYFLLPSKAHAAALIAATNGTCGGTTAATVQAVPFTQAHAASLTPSTAPLLGSTGMLASAGATGDGGAAKRPRVEAANTSAGGLVGGVALSQTPLHTITGSTPLQPPSATMTAPGSLQQAPVQHPNPRAAFPGMIQLQLPYGHSPLGMNMGGMMGGGVGGGAGLGIQPGMVPHPQVSGLQAGLQGALAAPGPHVLMSGGASPLPRSSSPFPGLQGSASPLGMDLGGGGAGGLDDAFDTYNSMLNPHGTPGGLL